MWPGPTSLVPCSLGLEHGGAGPRTPRSGALDLLNKNSNWHPRPLAQRSSQDPARSQCCQAGNRREVLTPWCLSLGRRLRHRSPAMRGPAACALPPSPQRKGRDLQGAQKSGREKGRRSLQSGQGGPADRLTRPMALGPSVSLPRGLA